MASRNGLGCGAEEMKKTQTLTYIEKLELSGLSNEGTSVPQKLGMFIMQK